MEAEAARGKTIQVEATQSNREPVDMKSPPVQTMTGYDPNRIPSSIFSTSPSPGDWSGTSNESLFSIQMGNNSFSKDYAIMFGKPPEFDSNQPESNPLKSGDLPRLDEWSKRNANNNRGTQYSTLTPVAEVPSRDERSCHSGDLSQNQTLAAGKPNHTPRLSDPSNMSFAFPVLVSESTKTDYSVKVAPEIPVSGPQKAEAAAPPQPQHKHKVAAYTPKRWFSCMPCSWPRCC